MICLKSQKLQTHIIQILLTGLVDNPQVLGKPKDRQMTSLRLML